jgi:hypothetical protein
MLSTLIKIFLALLNQTQARWLRLGKFERNANKDIEMLYESARKAIGLS